MSQSLWKRSRKVRQVELPWYCASHHPQGRWHLMTHRRFRGAGSGIGSLAGSTQLHDSWFPSLSDPIQAVSPSSHFVRDAITLVGRSTGSKVEHLLSMQKTPGSGLGISSDKDQTVGNGKDLSPRQPLLIRTDSTGLGGPAVCFRTRQLYVLHTFMEHKLAQQYTMIMYDDSFSPLILWRRWCGCCKIHRWV